MSLAAFASVRAPGFGVFARDDRVELVMPGRRGALIGVGQHGIVEDVADDGWVIWRDSEGRMHITHPRSLRKDVTR